MNATRSAAAEPPLERAVERLGVVARMRIEPSVVPLTGLVTLTVHVEGLAPLAVEPIQFEELRGWRIKTAGELERVALANGRERWEQSWRLIPDQPGELRLPLAPVRVRPRDRESTVELTFEPLAVRITTELPRVDLDEARDVTGPEAAPPAPPPTLAIWLAAGIAVTMLVAVWKWRHRHRHRDIPHLTPAAWLDAELARLAALEPAAPTAAEALSVTVRGYLARHHHVTVDGRTTAELFASLPPGVPLLWRELLERCDLAKFARVGLTPAEWSNALDQLGKPGV